MKKAIGAGFFHCCEAKDEATRHNMCPRDEQSWCKYWHSKITGSPYVEKKGIPEVIKKELRDIFDNLAKDELLATTIHKIY